jgi:hypothetical protein
LARLERCCREGGFGEVARERVEVIELEIACGSHLVVSMVQVFPRFHTTVRNGDGNVKQLCRGSYCEAWRGLMWSADMARYLRPDGVLESTIAIHRTAAPAHVAHRQASR